MLVIGEAANPLSLELKQNTKYIPWSNIIGLRNIIAHDYDEIVKLLESWIYTGNKHVLSA